MAFGAEILRMAGGTRRGDRTRAREHYRVLVRLAGGADAGNRAEIRQARAFLSEP